jgi:hypothetical protein
MSNENPMRDEFFADLKDTLARRVGMRCSNPNCRKPTSRPRDDPNKAVNIGVAAHITAASLGGPRYDETISSEERKSIENGIWLCQNCAKLVDNDAERFTADILRRWKSLSEEAARLNVETATSPTFLQWYLELDREIYKKIRQMLPWNGSVRFIREYSFDGLSFSIQQFSDLYQFCDECQNPNFEFIDADSEGIRINLLEKIQQFLEVIARETYPEGMSDVNRIPWEWRVEQPEHFERVVGQLNGLASQIGKYYDSLGKIGRRRLGAE